jgi:hypothetical protein
LEKPAWFRLAHVPLPIVDGGRRPIIAMIALFINRLVNRF